jgi:uncharacterized membrane protein YdjX (TVP38/TMEM64 family)
LTASIGTWFQQLGPLTLTSGAALGLFFVVAAFVVFPKTVLLLSAGATFGLHAAPVILLGGTAGGILAFSFSRYVASTWFRKRLARNAMLGVVAQAVDDEGWRIVALMRLGGPLPNAVQNYAFGLTNIHLATYALATFVFSAPQTFLFTFLGATGRASIMNEASSSLLFSLLAMVLTVSIIALISWRVKSLLGKVSAPSVAVRAAERSED